MVVYKYMVVYINTLSQYMAQEAIFVIYINLIYLPTITPILLLHFDKFSQKLFKLK